MRRVILVLALAFSLSFAFAYPAPGKGIVGTKGRTLVVLIGDGGSKGGDDDGGGGSTVTCLEVGNTPSVMFTVTGRYSCANGLIGFQGCYGACVPGSSVPGKPIDVQLLIDGAMKQVPVPKPMTSPPLVRDGEYGVVGIPFFFGVPARQWRTVSPSATDGVNFLTINATPSSLRFDAGDGGAPVVCNNPGRAVRDREQAARAKSLGCFHLYQEAATGDGYSTALSIVWNLSVTTNMTEDQYVNLVPATMTTTTNIVVPIIEIQAVLANPNG